MVSIHVGLKSCLVINLLGGEDPPAQTMSRKILPRSIDRRIRQRFRSVCEQVHAAESLSAGRS